VSDATGTGTSTPQATTAEQLTTLFALGREVASVLDLDELLSRVWKETGFFLTGRLVEFNETKRIFTAPAMRETEDYITGRFG